MGHIKIIADEMCQLF